MENFGIIKKILVLVILCGIKISYCKSALAKQDEDFQENEVLAIPTYEVNEYIENSPYEDLQYQTLPPSTELWEVSDEGRYKISSLTKSFTAIMRNAFYFYASIFYSTLFPYRYIYLREVADGINGVIDYYNFLFRRIARKFRRWYRVVTKIPFIGWLLKLPIDFFRLIFIVPFELYASLLRIVIHLI